MRKVFTTVIIIFLAGSGGLLISILSSAMKENHKPAPVQPIEFNHILHKQEDLECINCHTSVLKEAWAGMPSLKSCALCHAEESEEAAKYPESIKVVGYVQRKETIEWSRLFLLPGDIVFSHLRHVTLGKLDCNQCHEDIGESKSPPTLVLEHSMEFCISCHDRMEVTTDCLGCHK